MAESTIGRGVIELSTDGQKLKAGIDEAKRSLNQLGIAAQTATKSSSASIDKYVRSLGVAAVTTGKTAREAELLRLGLRGATAQQLAAADAALRMTEAHEKGVKIGQQLRASFIAFGLAASVAAVAAAAAFESLINKAGSFQDLAEKTGDTAENFATLAVSAAVGGRTMEEVAAASAKLTKGLTGVDDETKGAGAAIVALGLDLEAFKNLKPADQFDAVAKALAGFEDGTNKTAVAIALFGRAGADMLPFLKELGAESGRQKILTQEQIELADAHADRQKKLRTEISLHAAAIAAEFLPSLNDLSTALLRTIKEIAGVSDGTAGLKNSNDIQSFAEAGADALAKLVNAGQVVARTFEVVGKGIAAQAAIINRVIHGEIGEAIDIGKRHFQDAKEIFNRDLFSTSLEAARAARKSGGGSGASIGARPRLNFTGPAKDGKGGAGRDTAAQEAKARLALDLDAIKNAAAAEINTLSNAEKTIAALHAAGRVDEEDHYRFRREILLKNTAVQEDELQKEIARLKLEKFTGDNAVKDQLENDKKVADAQAKLVKVREDAGAQLNILAINEDAANKKIAQSFRNAEDAAQDFLDTLRKSNAAALAGIGAGAVERQRAAGRAQIEDKFNDERQRLNRERRDKELAGTFGVESQKKYDEELNRIKRFQALALEEFDTYSKARVDLESDWVNGAREALQNYADNSRNAAAMAQESFTNAFKSIEDALVELVTTGKFNFKSLVNSILADAARTSVRKTLGLAGDSILGAVGSGGGGLGGLISGLLGGGGPLELGGNSFMPSAEGGHRSAGQPLLVGERGPELWVPDSSGTVVPNGGAGGVVVNVAYHVAGALDRKTQDQTAARTGAAVQRAVARNT